MSCLHPKIRVETWEKLTAKDGHKYYKSEVFGQSQIQELKQLAYSGYHRKVQKIPCGKCIECRLNNARDWGTRSLLQTLYEKDNTCWFITFTYSDEYLKTHKTVNIETGEIHEGVSLYNKDMQDMWKRMRKRFPNSKIKYLEAGEYGGQTMRPHYHAIIYDLPLDITLFKKIGMSKLNQPEWTTIELTEPIGQAEMAIWPWGNVTIGEASFEATSYVARYTTKKTIKQYDDWWYKSQGLAKEYLHMSNGIGMQYYYDNKTKIYRTDSVPITNKRTGALVKPPKAYDRKLQEEEPDLWEFVQKKREEEGISSEYAMLTGTNDSFLEILRKKEERYQEKFKEVRNEI